MTAMDNMNLQLLFESVLLVIVVLNSVNVLLGHYPPPLSTLSRVKGGSAFQNLVYSCISSLYMTMSVCPSVGLFVGRSVNRLVSWSVSRLQ